MIESIVVFFQEKEAFVLYQNKGANHLAFSTFSSISIVSNKITFFPTKERKLVCLEASKQQVNVPFIFFRFLFLESFSGR